METGRQRTLDGVMWSIAVVALLAAALTPGPPAPSERAEPLPRALVDRGGGGEAVGQTATETAGFEEQFPLSGVAPPPEAILQVRPPVAPPPRGRPEVPFYTLQELPTLGGKAVWAWGIGSTVPTTYTSCPLFTWYQSVCRILRIVCASV